MIRLPIVARLCGLNLNYLFAPRLAWSRGEPIRTARFNLK